MPERAQLLDRRLGVLDDLVEPGRDRAGAGLISRQPELDLDRDQPVLGAIVEIALQPQPLARARLDDPRTRPAQLLDEPHAIGDVLHHAHHALRPVVLVALEARVRGLPDHLAVAADEPALPRHGLTAAVRVLHQPRAPFAIVGMHERGPVLVERELERLVARGQHPGELGRDRNGPRARVDLERAELRDRVRPREEVRLVAQLRERGARVRPPPACAR